MSEDFSIGSQQQELLNPVVAAQVASNDSTVVVADGEYHQLIQSLEEEDDVIATNRVGTSKSKINDDIQAWYGHPLSSLEAKSQISNDDNRRGSLVLGAGGGLLWNITIVPIEMLINNTTTASTNLSSLSSSIKRNQGLNHRDFFVASSLTPAAAATTTTTTKFPALEQPKTISAATSTTTTYIQIKPRRPSLPLSVKDFVSSLTKVDMSDRTATGDEKLESATTSRYIFNGVLNGWPGLRTLELLSLEYRRNSSPNNFSLPSPRELLSGQLLWVKAWSIQESSITTSSSSFNSNDVVQESNTKSVLDATTTTTTTTPILLQPNRLYRATVRGPSWTAIGWSLDSPGFCFWYETQRPSPLLVPSKVTYGTRMIHELSHRDNKCTYIHMISHRYAVNRVVETPRDRLTYHSICLLEWDHGLYCTLVETAYLNGMGGYRGRSNWYDDKDVEPMNQLYRDFPDEMICPWRMTQSEIRCYDVPAKNLVEFRSYMSQYNESVPQRHRRFIDVRYTFSHPARLTFRSKVHIAQYLLNYILRDSSYGDLNRNCQTFAADFCSFIAGKKGIAPFHPVNRIEYQNRTHMFLYDSHLYEKKRNNKK